MRKLVRSFRQDGAFSAERELRVRIEGPGMTSFDDVQALTFDCYGTLIDWETGIASALGELLERRGRSIDRARLLERFAAVENTIQAGAPDLAYPRILERVAHVVTSSFGVVIRPADAERFGAGVGEWPPFPDTHDALVRLSSRFRLVVISNVDRESFARTQRRLDVAFDAVITAQDTGFWKPDPRMFESAFSRLRDRGIVPECTLHVAQSLFHDHVPAQRFGLRTAFVDRYGGIGGATPSPSVPVTPTVTVRTLAELADRLGCA